MIKFFCICLLFAFPMALAADLVLAQGHIAGETPFTQSPHMVKTIEHIEEDGTLVLQGGTKIVLSGIRWWTLLGGDGGENISAKDLLEKYTQEGPVKIYLEAAPKDRYGRLYAQVVSASGTWLQQNLLAQGLVMFWPDSGQNEALRQAENTARSAGLGRWGWSSDVVKCHNWDGFWGEGMAIIAGRVKEVRSFDRVVYMNFGENWWQDFTVKIETSWAQQHGWQGEEFVGKLVEVRGWLYWEGGPQITLEQPKQITPLSDEGGIGKVASCTSLGEDQG